MSHGQLTVFDIAGDDPVIALMSSEWPVIEAVDSGGGDDRNPSIS
jgi:hypothetical protein